MTTIIAIILVIISTAIASAIHGWGKVTKGIVMALHALIVSWATGAIVNNYWFSPLGIIPAGIYWYLYRTSKQAKAELSAQDTINNDPATLSKRIWKAVISYIIPTVLTLAVLILSVIVSKSYTFLILIPLLIGSVFIPLWTLNKANYSTEFGKKLGWNHGKFLDVRRFTEIVTGAVTGGLAIIAYIFSFKLIKKKITKEEKNG